MESIHNTTFFRDNANYTEILDLFICSNSIYKSVVKFEVCINVDLFSDHYPIKIQLKNGNKQEKIINQIKTLDYSKANWIKFKNQLEQIDINEILKSTDVDEINEFIVTNIIKTANESIPVKNSKNIFHTKIRGQTICHYLYI